MPQKSTGNGSEKILLRLSGKTHIHLMPDKPRRELTYEDLVRELGYDKMSFFSDMVRPDQHEEREEDADLPTVPTSREVTLTPEHERAIIEGLEQYFGRKPTRQEINLALDQARSV
jgi:hypothetical protein